MIYLLRHGEDNEEFVGGWSNVDLTEKGIEQIKNITTFIKESNLDIKSIYSSDIRRAITTAKIISNELKINPVYTPTLRELNKGLLTGMEVSDALKKYPQYFQNIDIYTKYPDGESMIDLYYRIKKLLNNLTELDNSLLITHRGVINMIYFLLNNRMPDMDKSQFMVTHASLHELDMKHGKIKKLGGY